MLGPKRDGCKIPNKEEVGTDIPVRAVPPERRAFIGIESGAKTYEGSVLNRAAVGTDTKP